MNWSEKTQQKLMITIRTYLVIQDRPVPARELYQFISFNKKLSLPSFPNQKSFTSYLNGKLGSNNNKDIKKRRKGRTWYYEL